MACGGCPVRRPFRTIKSIDGSTPQAGQRDALSHNLILTLGVPDGSLTSFSIPPELAKLVCERIQTRLASKLIPEIIS